LATEYRQQIRPGRGHPAHFSEPRQIGGTSRSANGRGGYSEKGLRIASASADTALEDLLIRWEIGGETTGWRGPRIMEGENPPHAGSARCGPSYQFTGFFIFRKEKRFATPPESPDLGCHGEKGRAPSETGRRGLDRPAVLGRNFNGPYSQATTFSGITPFGCQSSPLALNPQPAAKRPKLNKGQGPIGVYCFCDPIFWANLAWKRYTWDEKIT